jgi:hypothetical protein
MNQTLLNLIIDFTLTKIIMNKKIILKKVTMTAGVVAMSTGLFYSFYTDANAGSLGGVCCQVDESISCYHPVYNTNFPNSIWEIGLSFCP